MKARPSGSTLRRYRAPARLMRVTDGCMAISQAHQVARVKLNRLDHWLGSLHCGALTVVTPS